MGDRVSVRVQSSVEILGQSHMFCEAGVSVGTSVVDILTHLFWLAIKSRGMRVKPPAMPVRPEGVRWVQRRW